MLKNRPKLQFLILATLMFALFGIDIFFGSVSIPSKDIANAFTDHSSVYYTIITDIRIPKAITAVLVGWALSASGVMMQTLFRNPLAGPYVLGVSSGASLGVSAFILFFSSFGFFVPIQWMQWGCTIAAMIGAAAVFSTVIIASMRIRDSATLLIIGMMMGAVSTALISILQHISDPDSVKMFINWTLGSLCTVTWTQLRIMLPCILVGVILIVFLIKPMDAFLLGEQEAQSVGVDVRNKRLMLIGLTVFLTGVSTAFTGPIGFVGIAVPHVSRLLLDTSIHRKIMPHSLLLGACMMLLSDIISQLPSNGYVIPINAITSLMGIPIVIWMVLGNNRIK